MSIDFSKDYEAPVVTASITPMDDGELSLRPRTLRDYTGQEKAKETMEKIEKIYLESRPMRPGMGPGMGQGGFGGGQMPQMSEEQRAQMQERMKQMQENMEAYDAELEKIFTPEQFKAYKEDQEKNRARRGGGPRPQ